MEQVTIWYQTDNEEGKKIAAGIKNMGLTVNTSSNYDLKDANILEDDINIFIYDFLNIAGEKIIDLIEKSSIQYNSLKFIISSKKEIKELSKNSIKTMHLEFVARPIYSREFLLLIEKSILVERYREMMKFISKESENRIETYEGLMEINRKNVFNSENEKQAFEKIIKHEKGLLREQNRLNKAIKDFSLLRQSEIFDMKKRIDVEDRLSDLRYRELFDAKTTIDAQGNVLDFSATKLDEANKLLSASELVVELSRQEAIDLHNELEEQKEMNKELLKKIEELTEKK